MQRGADGALTGRCSAQWPIGPPRTNPVHRRVEGINEEVRLSPADAGPRS